MAKKAHLEYDGKKISLPVVIGTENELGIDISKLRSKNIWNYIISWKQYNTLRKVHQY